MSSKLCSTICLVVEEITKKLHKVTEKATLWNFGGTFKFKIEVDFLMEARKTSC